MYEYRIKSVDKIVDGDTIDVRLYGINAPESRTRDLEEKKRGLEAKARLTELILSCFLEDHYLALQTKEKGKFGRYLGILIRRAKVLKEGEEFELDLNQQLVREGHAVDYFGGKR